MFQKRFSLNIALIVLVISVGLCKSQSDSYDDFNDNFEDESFEDGSYQEDEGLDDEYSEREARAASNAVWAAGINMHNRLRKIHGSPSLVGDNKLHSISQKYAEKLAANGGKLVHSIVRTENLATSNAATKVAAVKDAIQRWYDEKKDYNYSNGAFSPKTGHFTAMIWAGAKRLGIGVAKVAGQKNKWVVVATYEPKVNTNGKFQENVKKPVG